MKLLRLQFVTAMLAFMLGLAGCSQKKPVLVAPRQQPMTAPPEPAPTPEPTPTPQPVEQAQETQPAAPTIDQAATKPKPKTTKRPVAKKPASPATAPGTGEKPAGTEVAKNTVTKVRVPADKEPSPSTGGQISPAASPADNAQTLTATEQLLQKAEANLNSLKRQLTREEEAIKTQIKEFIDQSRKAEQEKDMLRAHNLAVKARLLSDDLVKQP